MNTSPANQDETVEPRVLLVSMRAGHPTVNRCFTFEFEDVIQAVDHVARLDLETDFTQYPSRRRRKLDQRFPRLSAFIGGNPPAVLKKSFDVVFVSCGVLPDLEALVPLQRILDAGQISACLVEEIWAHSLHKRKQLNWLKQFDFLFTECLGAVDKIKQLTGRPTAYVPPAVDTLRWCRPEPGFQRCIDILWYGRRLEKKHAELKALAEQRGLFYLYDTTLLPRVANALDHRVMLSQLVRRARCVIVYPAKIDREQEHRGQLEIGYRFFEATAGGAILVGEHPQTPIFQELFGWPEVVCRLSEGSGQVESVIMPILENHTYRRQVSLRNRLESVRRHDVAYRWRTILQTLGVKESPKMKARLDRLDALAAHLSDLFDRTDLKTEMETDNERN